MRFRTVFAQRLVCSATVIAFSMGVTGCATQGGGTGGYGSSAAAAPALALTPAEQKLRADRARFDNTVIGGVLKGAMIGAATGVVSAVLAGGNRNDAAKAGVVGAVAGGAMGGMDGYKKAKLQQAKMDEVQALQAAANDVRTDNGRLQAFLDSSSTVLSEGRHRLAALKGDVDAKRISASQAEAARQREEQNIAQMQTTLNKAKETRTQYAQASASFQGTPSSKRDLDAEIARMDQKVSALERNISDYSRALAVSKA